MLKRFRPVSLILLVGALGFSGNLYATPMSGIPRVDISQQNAKVSGIVEDALGPVTGASVIVKGTTNGTMTDLDGHFTLDNVKKGDIIQISFIGYTSQDIPYTGQPEITVKPVESPICCRILFILEKFDGVLRGERAVPEYRAWWRREIIFHWWMKKLGSWRRND